MSFHQPVPTMAQAPGERCCILISSDIELYSINIDSDKMATICHTIVTFIALIFFIRVELEGAVYSNYSVLIQCVQ